MEPKVKMTYTNINGKTVIVGPFPPFRLMDYSGFGSLDNNITSVKVYGLDGEQKIDSSISYRDMELDILLQGSDFEEKQEIKRELMAAFNPKLSGTLRVDFSDKAYEIDVEVLKGFDPQYQRGTVQFRALDPFWRDVSKLDYTVQLGQTENLFEFPWIITPSFEFATVEMGKDVEIINQGDVVIGMEINIQCTAEVVNPRLVNIYSQEYFAFNHTFKAGDVIYINTNRGKKEVLVNGANGFFMRKLGTTFLQLDNQEKNYFKLEADDGIENMIADMKYNPILTGV